MAMALEGVRILDLTQVWAGPTCMKLLGDMGAQVIKIESYKRMDTVRGEPNARPGGAGIYPDDNPGVRPWNRTGHYNDRNRSKLDICLDLTEPRGVETFKRLVAVSDVVGESFRVGVMERFGLSYQELKKVNPDIIMISLSSQGATGPERSYGSFGATLEQTAGIASFTGYLGGNPTTSGTFFPDPVVAVLGAGSIVAALRHRNRTGQGMYIDLSQRETTTNIIGEAVLDYTMNGRAWEPMGNRHRVYAPQGVYRCQGDDMWIAVTVKSDAQWAALCGVMGEPALAHDPRYADVLGRHQHHAEIDVLIEEWTQARDAFEAMRTLQQAGVPAGVALKGNQLLENPHLNARKFWDIVEHPEAGTHPYLSRPFLHSKTPGATRMPAPLLGQHTEMVLREIARLSEAEIRELAELGITSNIPIGAPEEG
ncbi:MAG: CoA transferase [Chloroflexi bacterium]|nr:CoA transferase [Chloroflexota bacterium]